MPEYLSPGVYIEEVERGPKPIEGVSTSTAGFLGETERGSTEPERVTSFAEFKRLYGGYVENRYLAHGVEGFFRNGGQRAYVGRVTAATETAQSAFAAVETSPGQIGLSRSTVDFRNSVVDRTATDTVTVTNLGGVGDPSIPLSVASTRIDNNQDDAYAVEFDDVTLAPGDSTEVTVRFTPANRTANSADLVLSHADTGADLATVRLQGKGEDPASGTLAASPSPLDFETVVPGASRTLTATLSNLGDPDAPSASRITVEEIDVTGGSSREFTTDLVGSRDVDPNEKTRVEVTFAPRDTAPKSLSLEVAHTGSASPTTVTLEASPTNGELGTPTPEVDFGAVPEGNAVTRRIQVWNLSEPGTQNPTAVQVEAADLSFQGDTENEFSATVQDTTLDPSTSATIEVTYTPESTEGTEATLRLAYGGPGPLDIPLVARAAVAEVEAVGPGTWGQRVALEVEDASLYKPGENELFKLTLRYWSSLRPVENVPHPTDEQRVEAQDDPAHEEVFDNLSPDTDSSDFYEKRITDVSTLVEISNLAADGGRPPNGVSMLHLPPDATADPQIQVRHFQGDDQAPPGERTGLEGFREVDPISIVCVPDEHAYGHLTPGAVTDAVKDHCEKMKDRFAVLQSPQGPLQDPLPPVDSEYAAFYHPWLEILDPRTGGTKLVPPGGHVVGVYARSDTDRGVHKAPANEIVRGATELEFTITKGDQDVYNPRGINIIRSFPGRGIRVWGARTTSSDPLWKYVNVRRLFLYIEESIEEGTQWVVFEPNDEQLWARVRQTISNFLTSVWNDGMLMGTTPEEAFYVKCDRSTMTQNDIDNGRLIVEIGVSPVKPAEFVVFRISQWTGGAEGA